MLLFSHKYDKITNTDNDFVIFWLDYPLDYTNSIKWEVYKVLGGYYHENQKAGTR